MNDQERAQIGAKFRLSPRESVHLKGDSASEVEESAIQMSGRKIYHAVRGEQNDWTRKMLDHGGGVKEEEPDNYGVFAPLIDKINREGL